MEARTERVVLQTSTHRIVGELKLPPESYRSRFSDLLNRADLHFIPLTDVEISRLDGSGPTERQDFAAVGRDHVELAYEAST